MASRRLFCGFIFSYALAGGIACSIMVKGDSMEYDFNDGFKHRRLIMSIPPGAIEESHDRDAKGFLVRTFRFDDGARVYVACHDLEKQPVVQIDTSTGILDSLSKALGSPGCGTYADGRKWCRYIRGGFLVGYDFVDPRQKELFDHSLHSSHIVH